MKIEKNGFTQFSLAKETIETLELLGYHQGTPVQEQVIPRLLNREDVVVQSQTGSGKTAAFGIPICDQVDWLKNQPQALILEPTRELAVQVQEELFQIGRMRRIKVPAVFGGMPIEKEILSLKQKSHIVVGTPGRVMDHIRRGSLVLSDISYLIIDEADLMLDMGFLEEVGQIISMVMKESLSEKPLTKGLFSATMPEEIDGLGDLYFSDAAFVQVASDSLVVSKIQQGIYFVEKEEKFPLLLRILEKENPGDAMIFCETREMVNTLFEKLRRKKIRCGMLHGGMEQRDRLYSIGDFRQGKFHIYITTDVAARGIDFPEITHVINYDFPTKKENYVHRIGRSGRNGKSGTAISFVAEDERRPLEEVEKYIGENISVLEGEAVRVSSIEKEAFRKRQREKVVLKEGRGQVFSQSITKLTIGGGKKSKIRAGDVVGTLCAIPGMTSEDIGVIDVRDSITYVEILNGKGEQVYEALQNKMLKGKLRKISYSRK